jgi:type IV fimbrial biogenesis protein FimT
MGFAHALTSVISSRQSALRPLFESRLTRHATRGFTLVELVAVVVIIAIVAALAIPTIGSRLRDRRTQQVAQTVAQLYSTARMRAMGRGAAVLVRYNNGVFEIREAIRGNDDDPNCDPLPVSSCQVGDPWDLTDQTRNRLITTFDPANRSQFEGVKIAMSDATNTATSAMDVCFTPMGGAFVGNVLGGALNRLAGVPVASVWRENPPGTTVGLTRIVRIMPNGNSHLGTAQPP